jgi:recombination associated protein RdgC
VAFTLTDAMRLKKISFLDGVVGDDADDGFDADVALATGELAPMIAALVEALGGELEV